MLKRIITAIIALTLFVPVLYFSGTPLFPSVVALLSVIALYEVLNCLNVLKKYIISLPLLSASIVLPLLSRFKTELVLSVFIFIIVYIGITSVICFKTTEIVLISTVLYEFLLITGGFSALVLNRDAMPYKYLLIFIAAWSTDTFAIFAGKFFGNRKLCPDVSPKKTVAGAIGGIIGAMIVFLIYGLIINIVLNGNEKYIKLLILAIPLSGIGQFGDLAQSVFKRNFKIKDFGNIFPGHGGVLDRFDSVLPISLVLLALNMVIKL